MSYWLDIELRVPFDDARPQSRRVKPNGWPSHTVLCSHLIKRCVAGRSLAKSRMETLRGRLKLRQIVGQFCCSWCWVLFDAFWENSAHRSSRTLCFSSVKLHERLVTLPISPFHGEELSHCQFGAQARACSRVLLANQYQGFRPRLFFGLQLHEMLDE